MKKSISHIHFSENIRINTSRSRPQYRHQIEIIPLQEAFNSFEYADLAMQVSVQHLKYMSEGDDIGASCAVCHKPWSVKRPPPESMLRVTPCYDGGHQVLALICKPCSNDKRLIKRVLGRLGELGYDVNKPEYMPGEAGHA